MEPRAPEERVRRGLRRWLRLGPATTFALLIAAIILLQYAGKRQAPHGPPVVQRQVQPAAHPGAGSYPEVQFLLDRRERVSLTPDQVARLSAIQKRWEQSTAADRRALLEETRRFRAFLHSSQRKGSTSLAETEQHSAALGAASAAVAASRYEAWQQALSVLDTGRRPRAEQLRQAEARPWKAR